MKANRKFTLSRDDDAVSPVIAVILMVAITVVLAATVYVWVSGFSNSGGEAAKTMALTSDGGFSNGHKNYTVASATPGLKWQDIKITVNGADYNQTFAASDGVSACPANVDAPSRYLICSNSVTETGDGTIDAGDSLRIKGLSSGQTLRILDREANSVILTLNIG